jgi:hypothetical protein
MSGGSTSAVNAAIRQTASALVAARLASIAAIALAVLVVAQLFCLAVLSRRLPDRVVVADSSLVRPLKLRSSP